MQNLFKNMPEGTKKLASVIVPMLILIALFAVVAKFGISKVSDLRTKITNAQKDETVLTEKAKLLATVSDTLSAGTVASTGAMPESNSSLIVLSQLKILAGTKGVFISNIKAGSEVKDDTGLSRVDLTFDSRGPKDSIISFVGETSKIAPITKLTKLKITQTSGETLATVTVSSFWSQLPKTIPSVTESVNDLTPAERNILIEVSKLIQPLFIDIQATEGGKDDPFGI